MKHPAPLLATGLAALGLAAFLLPAAAHAVSAGEESAQGTAAEAKPHKSLKRHTSRRPAHRWRGYGFLPGYTPPPRQGREIAEIPGREYSYHGPYWYGDHVWYGYGPPRFYRGRWNGGSFGPCWTSTPIGFVWNCGK